MKTIPILLACAAVVAARAQTAPVAADQRLAPAAATQGPAENQRLYGQATGKVLLVTPVTAEQIVTKFRAKYDAPSAPRFIVYVNRALVDTRATATESPGTDGKQARPALADQQTVRDIERLFGRVFRNAGANLADSQIAVDMLAQRADEQLTGDRAVKNREALLGVADIAVEVLISTRQVTVPGIAGDQVVAIPDIQATAIRLKDAAIVGQASASDVLGKDLQAIRIARSYDARDITEATAFALMEDMLTGK